MSFPDGPEIELPSGDVSGRIVRIGDTVRRPHREHSAIVARYLAYLDGAGFEGAPQYLGRDGQGRDVLTFLAGDVPGSRPEGWATADPALADVARLVRRLHDASGAMPVPAGQPQPGEPPLAPGTEPAIVSHRDVTPQNTVFRNGAPWGLIDFDLAGVTTRSVDFVNTAMHWVPLCDPVDRDRAHGEIEVGGRFRLMYDAYGRDHFDPARLLDSAEHRFTSSHMTMLWRAENLGGGWARLWREGVGDVIRRRIDWFAGARAGLARDLGGG